MGSGRQPGDHEETGHQHHAVDARGRHRDTRERGPPPTAPAQRQHGPHEREQEQALGIDHAKEMRGRKHRAVRCRTQRSVVAEIQAGQPVQQDHRRRERQP